MLGICLIVYGLDHSIAHIEAEAEIVLDGVGLVLSFLLPWIDYVSGENGVVDGFH